MTAIPEPFTVLRDAGLAGRVVHVPQPRRLAVLAGQETMERLQHLGFADRILYIPRRPRSDESALASVITTLQAAGLGGRKVYVPPLRSEDTHPLAVQTALQHMAQTRKKLYVPRQRLPEDEALVQALLDHVESIYERTGSALITANPRRPGWAFVRALGATRWAHLLGVPRDAIVQARRRAFLRWRYWLQRYEQPLWQTLQAQRAQQQWETQYYRYLACRAAVRRGAPVSSTDPLLPFARRSLASRSWKHEPRPPRKEMPHA